MITLDSAEAILDNLRALVRRHREVSSTGSRQLSPGMLPDPLGALLSQLSAADSTRSTDLAEKLRVTVSTLSRQITHAESCGYIQRRPDPDDGRASLLSLTPLGVQTLVFHRRAQAQRLIDHLDGWTEEDAVDVACALDRLRRSTCPESHAAH
ncbi:MarR family winged helix-turn-helix transcriptional regulator [Rhodococcus erythropolis]|uniref:MarR family winged helix-turn-helix transcriptional regulator n=1 Tax=Rhodococcus erythropolis TaxID=1833 RepID=UPI0036DA6D3A